jgi:hypothetical protein
MSTATSFISSPPETAKDDDVLIQVYPGMTFPCWVNGRTIDCPGFNVLGTRATSFGFSPMPWTFTAEQLGLPNALLIAYLADVEQNKWSHRRNKTPAEFRALRAQINYVRELLIVHVGAWLRRRAALMAFHRFN